ncbi:hypothetical protein U8527_10325 [Kordia algicida OT-1]|uniref:Uncharacterized protein n=1 Tax=Kordia algicida OT-1 TaxID=391587 RepID=A9DW27_9FLAO|nr:hypothetical protein [Kordia algicida]EDP96501.1 hypothetical protein KAOT1_03792 [Kordia algicida OT-1]
MDHNTKFLLGICGIEVLIISIIIILYLRNTPNKYQKSAKPTNEVDDELEKELQNKSKQ